MSEEKSIPPDEQLANKEPANETILHAPPLIPAPLLAYCGRRMDGRLFG